MTRGLFIVKYRLVHFREVQQFGNRHAQATGQPDKWGIKSQTRYFKILQKADETKELSYSYYDGCLLDRNRYMVDRTGTLLAVYNGEYRGGTAATIRYARKLDREIIIIDPATGKISQDA